MAAANSAKNLYRLFVGNLPWTVSGLELKQYFSQFGHVSNAKVIFNRDTGMSKHYGFVDIINKDTYESIINRHAHKLEGKLLTNKLAMTSNFEKVETSQLEETFSRAANHLQSLVAELDTGQLLGFYGLYKQATSGTCDIPRPNWYQTQAKHKWEAWKNLGEMSKESAMENYIRAVGKLDPTWEQNSRVGGKAWVAVSTLACTDVELGDSDKTLFDWVKDGDANKVLAELTKDPTRINDADDSGMMPIHWAADRGQVETIKCLVESGADFNAQDLHGQTALHYAASCSHVEAVEYLLSLGAKSLEDNDGMTPKDVADRQLVDMF